jgi:ribosomal protein S18 acetylase RimI-like enzyme
MTPTIRAATNSDVDAVLVLWRQAGAEPTHTDDAGSLRQLIAQDPRALLVAEAEQGIVGSVIAAWDGWRGSIYRLAVAPSYRRQGLARRLLFESERKLSESGATRLQAIVVESDSPALAFWRSTGWEQQVERRRFVNG